MSDSTFEIFVDPSAAYATKPNIRYPGTSVQATAQAARAITVINDRLPAGVSITGLTVTVANP